MFVLLGFRCCLLLIVMVDLAVLIVNCGLLAIDGFACYCLAGMGVLL